MPCYDSRDDPPNVRDDARHNSDVAEMLCSVCKWMENNGELMTPKMAVWWREHKERDRKRAEQERLHRQNRLMRLREVSAQTLTELDCLLKKVK